MKETIIEKGCLYSFVSVIGLGLIMMIAFWGLSNYWAIQSAQQYKQTIQQPVKEARVIFKRESGRSDAKYYIEYSYEVDKRLFETEEEVYKKFFKKLSRGDKIQVYVYKDDAKRSLIVGNDIHKRDQVLAWMYNGIAGFFLIFALGIKLKEKFRERYPKKLKVIQDPIPWIERSIRWKIVVYLILGFFLCIPFALLIGINYSFLSSYFEYERLEKSGIKIEALVTDESATSGSKSPTSYHVRYEYEFEGQKFKVREETMGLSSTRMGETTTIWINPNNPSESLIIYNDAFYKTGFFAAIFDLLALWALIWVLKEWWKERKSKTKPSSSQ